MSHFASAKHEDWIEIVRGQVQSMRFGAVQIVVHEGKVVQIEKTEKVRLSDAVVSSVPHIVLPNRTTGGSNNIK